MNRSVCAMAIAASGLASAGPVTPDGIGENPGNSFTQRWQQTDAGDIVAMAFEFVDVPGATGDIDLTRVKFPTPGWGGDLSGNPFADQHGSLFFGFGPEGTNTIRFNLTFDGENAGGGNSQGSGQQVFGWRVTYFLADGTRSGWEWSNSGDTGVYNVGRGFGGAFRSLSQGEFAQFIPLPHPGALAACGLAGLAIIRRRRAA